MTCFKRSLSFLLIYDIIVAIDQSFGEQPIGRPVLSIGDNDIYANAETIQYIPYQTADEPRYLIVAPSQVRPGQVYRVVVNLLESPFPLTLTASVQRNNEEIAGVTEKVVPGESQNLLMKIPFTARSGNYQLKVEGNANRVRGGHGFARNTTLNFLPEFLTILVQTNQLVFNIKQTISIRVILLNMQMKPYVDAIDIFLLDSQGIIMKRWNSIYPFQGFVSVEFRLPADYPKGWWTVKVQALQQIEEKKILVERWFTDRIDVSVSLPAFVSQSEPYLEGTLYANHTNLLPVSGNATIRVIVLPQKMDINWRVLNGDYDNYSSFSEYDIFKETLKIETIDNFQGSYDFRYDMRQLFFSPHSTPFTQKEIVVHAEVGERFFDHKVSGYARTRIINSTIVVRFLDTQPVVFKPGLPFETYISVSYSHSVALPQELLSMSSLYISPSFALNKYTVFNQIEPLSKEVTDNSLQIELDEFGVGKVQLRPPKNIDRFTINARLVTPDVVATTSLIANSFFSTTNRMIQITTSTETGIAGNYGIFHVYGNFYMRTFNYLVVAKGNILITGQELVTGMLQSVTTFSVSLSPEMAPNCNVIVYHITSDGEVIADSISLPVEGINRAKLNLKVNLNQDRSGNVIEFIPYLSKASKIGHSAVDTEFDDIQGFNDITKAKSEIAIRKFETKFSKKVIHKTLEGIDENAFYFVTNNNARDSGSTFAFFTLVALTNMKLSLASNRCNPNLFYNHTLDNQFRPLNRQWTGGHGLSDANFISLMCLTGQQCYEVHQQCDGIRDCIDGSDELFCHKEVDASETLSDFIIYRKNRNNYFYSATENNFAWIDHFTSYNPDNYVGLTVPTRPVNWRFNAIGVCQDWGFSVMEQFVYWNSVRPFFITVEAPSEVVIGEQIGIRVAAFNMQPFEVRADIILDKSDNYRFVHVGPMGRVSSYMPITSTGIHQHLVYIKPYSSLLVPLPMVATTTGTIKVVIIGRCQAAKDVKEIEMNVLADGVDVPLHTSLLLDMRSQSYLIKFLDIMITEDPVIPYEDTYRRYIFGSPQARVTVMGDVVGTPPIIDPIIDFTNMGIKSTAKSGELRMFNFAYRLYTLIYLRITNQLDNERQELAKKILEELSRDYVYQMTFYKNDSFVMFDVTGGRSSVWLTAYCARVYFDAQYDDWHNFIFIDPKVIQTSIEFLLRHQITDPMHDLNGAFYESFDNWSSSPRLRPVALTAHVLITLVKVTDVHGDLAIKTSSAKRAAVRFLERKLPALTFPYEVAITAYALMMAGSSEAKMGFNMLEESKNITEGMVYWSDIEIKPAEIVYQSQRPFIRPRSQAVHESLAVEGTSYALLVYSGFGGVIQDQIVKWLNFMRMYDEGFLATYDTIVAIQALTDYSFRTHVRSVTNMRLQVEASSNPGIINSLVLSPSNVSTRQVVDILPNVWGHVMLTAKGAGLAVVQLNGQYNVDRDFQLQQPPVPSFDVKVDMSYSGRNKSRIAIEFCAKWLLTKLRRTSGIAVMELTVPTGYHQNKALIDHYVQRRSVPRLSEAKVMGRSATFMFDYLDNEWSCVEFSVDRWLPVANLTRYLKARVYDLYEPELFQEKVVDGFALYALHICEVCGSYQCPYCPYFSHSPVITLNYSLLTLLLVISLFTSSS